MLESIAELASQFGRKGSERSEMTSEQPRINIGRMTCCYLVLVTVLCGVRTCVSISISISISMYVRDMRESPRVQHESSTSRKQMTERGSALDQLGISPSGFEVMGRHDRSVCRCSTIWGRSR
jgi:hypothetical protein